MLQSECLYVHVAGLCLFDRCTILGNSTDFWNDPCYLWCSYHPFPYGSCAISSPVSDCFCTPWLFHSLPLDLGCLAGSHHNHLAGAPNIWRYVWIFDEVVGYMQSGVPCYHILVFLLSLFPILWLLFLCLDCYLNHIAKYWYVKMSTRLLPIYFSQPLEPVAHLPWPGQDYFWSIIMLNLWHVHIICPCIFLSSWHIGIIYPCFLLLFFYIFYYTFYFIIILLCVQYICIFSLPLSLPCSSLLLCLIYVPWFMYMHMYGSYGMPSFAVSVPQKVTDVCVLSVAIWSLR